MSELSLIKKTESVEYDLLPVEFKVSGSEIISKLGEYIPLIKKLAEEQMSVVLETDEDFAKKEEFNKKVKEARENLKQQAIRIEKHFESLAKFNADVKQADTILQKLFAHGEKQVKEAKESKRQMLIADAEIKYKNHLIEITKDLGQYEIHIQPNWESIIKGKRNIESMEYALNQELERLKDETNKIAAAANKNKETLSEMAAKHRFLFNDYKQLFGIDNDELKTIIESRIHAHELKIEQKEKEKAAIENARIEKERIQQEEKLKQEKEKFEREAKEKAEREANAKLELEKKRIEEAAQKRIAEERANEAKRYAKEKAEREQKEKQSGEIVNNLMSKENNLIAEVQKWAARIKLSEKDLNELINIIKGGVE